MILINSNIKQLRERWKHIVNVDLRKCLPDGKSPFGRTDTEYADFRGVLIDISLHKLNFSNIDFSYCELNPGQFVSAATNCLFLGSSLKFHIGNNFKYCSFDKANLSESDMQGRFQSCTFVDTNLRRRIASQVRFVSCSFIRADLRRTCFYDCTFDQCQFIDCVLGSGSFGGSSFLNCVVDRLDFSTTVMDRVKGLT